MENNAPAREPAAAGRHHTGQLRVYGVWKGNDLWFKGAIVASIVQDEKYPIMWRVRMPNGELSDMVNRVRAKEAAYYLA